MTFVAELHPALRPVRRHVLPPVLLSLLALLAACGESVSHDEVPAWIPVYPGARVQLLDSSPAAGEVAGTGMVVLDASADKAFDFYRQAFEEQGFRVRAAPAESNNFGLAQLVAHDEKETRGVTITITPDGEARSHVLINYTQTR